MRGFREWTTHSRRNSRRFRLRQKADGFVRWTNLTGTEGKYRVELNVAERMGALASIATANSLTIVREGTVVDAATRSKSCRWTGAGLISVVKGDPCA